MMGPAIKPSIAISRRVVNQYDIVCDGVNPVFGQFNFSLTDLPANSEFSTLFQFYRIDEVSIRWYPEYTVLSDASALSNSVNVSFTTAVNISNIAPTGANDVLQMTGAQSTGITKEHSTKFRPAFLMNNIMPCSCPVLTNQIGVDWYGLAYGVPPTGISMTFRSVAVFKVTVMGVK